MRDFITDSMNTKYFNVLQLKKTPSSQFNSHKAQTQYDATSWNKIQQQSCMSFLFGIQINFLLLCVIIFLVSDLTDLWPPGGWGVNYLMD